MIRRSKLNSTLLGLGLLAITSLGLTACSDPDESSSTTTTASPGVSTTASTPATPKPTVVIPDTPPPATLQIKDLKVGDGAEAKVGATVAMQYVGVGYDSKQEFDASYNRGTPFTFTIGQGRVIQGWDEGIPGMKVGGQRELTIPGSLAYGPQGRPPQIGPNETLVFVVELVSVQ